MAKFVIWEDQGQGWRFTLVAANGERVAWGEAYSTKANAERAARWVQDNASGAVIEDAA